MSGELQSLASSLSFFSRSSTMYSWIRQGQFQVGSQSCRLSRNAAKVALHERVLREVVEELHRLPAFQFPERRGYLSEIAGCSTRNATRGFTGVVLPQGDISSHLGHNIEHHHPQHDIVLEDVLLQQVAEVWKSHG